MHTLKRSFKTAFRIQNKVDTMLVPEMSTSGLTTNNPFMSSMTQSLLTSSSRPSTFTISPWRIEVSNHVPFKVHFLLPFPVPKEKNRQISTNNYMIALIWRVLKSECLLPLPVPTEIFCLSQFAIDSATRLDIKKPPEFQTNRQNLEFVKDYM